MTYRLKDRELHQKLDDISSGDFSKQLQDEASRMFASDRKVGLVCFGPDARLRITLNRDEIEDGPRCDPHKWNRWPDVTPPEGVPMRFELYSQEEGEDTPESRGGDCVWRGCVTRDGNRLVSSELTYLAFDEGDTGRFRPWEDDDEYSKGRD